MTLRQAQDLVQRARAMAQGEARAGIGRQRRDLFEDLADEIERLRDECGICKNAYRGAVEHRLVMETEIERLRKRVFSAEATFRALQDANDEEDREVSR